MTLTVDTTTSSSRRGREDERTLTTTAPDTRRGANDTSVDGADRSTPPDRGLHTETRDTVTRILPSLHRLDRNGWTRGWVELAGSVFVALRGPVHLTAEEIGQSLDFECACALVWND